MAHAGVPEWEYEHGNQPWWNSFLVPPVMALAGEIGPGTRVLDIGCGNGHIAGLFGKKGATVVGVDPSESGVGYARRSLPEGRFEVDVATPDLRERLGEEPFDLVVSAEVVEHVYDGDDWGRAVFNALKPGGRVVLTTPYHGYLKNVLIAAAGKWDHHHTSLDAGSHIKFWSRATITELLRRNGLEFEAFRGAGRAPLLWMSMVVAARRPA